MKKNLYWCIEWTPGLLVIDLTPGAMQWAARRSPNPEFGGRRASKAEIQNFDAWELPGKRATTSRHRNMGSFSTPGMMWSSEASPVGTPLLSSKYGQSVVSWTASTSYAQDYPEISQSQPYREHIEACRRSIFWNMRWEDLD